MGEVVGGVCGCDRGDCGVEELLLVSMSVCCCKGGLEEWYVDALTWLRSPKKGPEGETGRYARLGEDGSVV